MKKLLLALLVLAVTTFSSVAQTTKSSAHGKFNIGADIAVPTGIASMVYNAAIGGSVKYEVPAATDLYFTLSAGYEAFLVKSEFKFPGSKSSEGYVPLKAGLKYYFKNGFFGEAQAGASIYTGSDGFTSFVYSPGIGYSFVGGFEAGG
ncbi:MAG: hypothetical protein JWR61_1863 [Ferruginibacter sp.]|uniref:hypothetical protein n=1 Tax=Ferruginibacter sp. TaxID=1940288 RepID=UPI002657BF20|nr:hypothetical protein [Ferruginibacter sp.]MDB5276908.1 hypothetical protein [Ferruginibacter sp.]